jgi:hypothetical protein
MVNLKPKTPARMAALPGLKNRSLTAACTAKLPRQPSPAKPGDTFRISPDGGEAFGITLKRGGRSAWALLELVKAGSRGCVPIERPAPRWSAYVHSLRRGGVPIATIRERHGGAFPGWHARYVLLASVIGGGRK